MMSLRRSLAVAIGLTTLDAPAPAAAQQAAAAPTAAAPAARSCPVEAARRYLDAFGGRWDVERSGRAIGWIHVTAEARGCLVHEVEFLGGDTTGITVAFYDAGTREWRSHFVGADGTLLRLAGTWARDTLRLEGPGYDGRPGVAAIPHRLTIHHVAADTVRQLVETSEDGGRTWRARWDVRWVRPRRSGPAPR